MFLSLLSGIRLIKLKGGGESKSLKKLKDWNKTAFIDKNTILGNKSIFTDTWKMYKKSKIYKNSSNWNYYYRDSAWIWWDVWHQHLEVFDKKYNHIWVADPITWEIDYSKAVSWRSIKNTMK